MKRKSEDITAPPQQQKKKDSTNLDTTARSLWNNPYVESARKSMTIQQLAEYQAIGEKVYGQMNFDNLEESVMSYVTYLFESVKSGLHPSYLSDDEKQALKTTMGDTWYEQLGFTSDDLNRIQ